MMFSTELNQQVLTCIIMFQLSFYYENLSIIIMEALYFCSTVKVLEYDGNGLVH